MAIADLLTKLTDDIRDSYDAVEEKGGTLPEHKNTDSLPDAIRSIEGGGSAIPEWGSIKYYSVWNTEWSFSGDMVRVDNVDEEVLENFLNEYPTDSPSFWFEGYEEPAIWHFMYDGGEITITPEDFTNTTGISYTPTYEPLEYASIYGEKEYVVDKSSPIVNMDLVENDLSEFSSYENEYEFDGGNIYRNAITEISIGSEWTDLPVRFCYRLDELCKINYLQESNLENIGDSCFSSCPKLNQPFILPSSLETIGGGFLGWNNTFNSSVLIQDGVTSIGSSFLGRSGAFNQPVALPNSVVSIGNSFLEYCISFNSTVSLPSGITSIPRSFLRGCRRFNQPLSLPSGVTSIGEEFLSGDSAFNQIVSLPSGLTMIKEDFLRSCTSYNQELNIPNSVTSIGGSFMLSCSAFNKKLVIPGSVLTIGGNFANDWSSFNSELVISDGVQQIGGSCFSSLTSFNKNLKIPSSVGNIGSNSFQHLQNMQGIIDLTGVNIGGISAEFNGAFCFYTSESSSIGYRNGIKIKCDDYASFLRKFPNGRQNPQTTYYRKTVSV